MKKKSKNKCKHCSKPTSKREGLVCDKCYSKYSAAMLCDMDQ